MLSFLNKYAKNYFAHVIMRVARVLSAFERLLPKSDTCLRGSHQWLTQSLTHQFLGRQHDEAPKDPSRYRYLCYPVTFGQGLRRPELGHLRSLAMSQKRR